MFFSHTALSYWTPKNSHWLPNHHQVEVGECKIWNKKIAEERLHTHALKQSGNIANAWIETGKKDCLSRD